MAYKIAVIGLGYVGLPLAHAFEGISTAEPVLIDIKGIVEDPSWRL